MSSSSGTLLLLTVCPSLCCSVCCCLKKNLNASRPSEHPLTQGGKRQKLSLLQCLLLFKKILNASRPSEHTPVRGGNVKSCLCWSFCCCLILLSLYCLAFCLASRLFFYDTLVCICSTFCFVDESSWLLWTNIGLSASPLPLLQNVIVTVLSSLPWSLISTFFRLWSLSFLGCFVSIKSSFNHFLCLKSSRLEGFSFLVSIKVYFQPFFRA